MNALVPHQAVPAFAMADIANMARAFAQSGLFGVKNADQALALCLVAQAEGRHPATAAQDYSIISGRPAKKADAMLRDFIASGGKVKWHKLDNDMADATFSHPQGGEVRIDWTIERAKAAGLGNNAMYSKYPRQMLRSRTVSEGVRTVCPGATSGMYVPEEAQDIGEARDVTDEPDFTGTVQPPKPKSQSREVFAKLNEGMREAAKGTEADLGNWFKANADDVGSLPNDWKAQLRNEYGEHLAACRNRAADPHSVFIEPPAADAEAGSWAEYVEDVLAAIAGAASEDEARAAQTVNSAGLTLSAMVVDDVPERLAKATEQRIAALTMKDAA